MSMRCVSVCIHKRCAINSHCIVRACYMKFLLGSFFIGYTFSLSLSYITLLVALQQYSIYIFHELKYQTTASVSIIITPKCNTFSNVSIFLAISFCIHHKHIHFIPIFTDFHSFFIELNHQSVLEWLEFSKEKKTNTNDIAKNISQV